MPDISMCQNTFCPIKEDCYRFKAKPSEYQTYADFEPSINEDGKVECDYFMEIYKKIEPPTNQPT